MRHIITPDYGTLRGFTEKKKTSHLFSTMPAASEINACCPTSLTLPKQPEDSADGFNGLLLSMFITAQICHVNTNFLNSDGAVIRPTPSKHVLYMFLAVLKEERKSAWLLGISKGLLFILVGTNRSRNTHTHKHTPHPPWQRWQCIISRWPSLPCLDEYRKRQPCTAEAEDTCLSQRSSLSSFSTVFLSLRSLMGSNHYWKALLISGVEEEQEEGGKTLLLMSFYYFLLAFLFCFFSRASWKQRKGHVWIPI